MEKFSGYPYVKIQFTREGTVFSTQEVQALTAMLAAEEVTDLLVISHGWNNDMADAKALYKAFLAAFAQVERAGGQHSKKFGVLGVMWPSKKFATEDLIPGSGAAAGLGDSGDLQELKNQLDNLKGFFDDKKANALLERAKTAAQEMDTHTNPNAAEEYVHAMEALLTTAIQSQFDDQEAEEGRRKLEAVGADELLARLEHVSDKQLLVETETGGAAALGAGPSGGSAAGLGDFFSSKLRGARNLLNYVTYYQMKERAGKVGSLGLHPLLVQLRQKFPQVRLHLIGHSFGARLVTAAVAGPNAQAHLQVDTLTLLQAAFSHYSLAEKYDGNKNGFFRRVVSDKKVKGPILISHTQNDKAVGLAYALASRLANQVAAAMGGPNDLYGGMGGNGAQKTPEAVHGQKLESTNPYTFQKGKIYNLNGDSCISDHSDICKEEVARALMSALAVAG